MVIIAITIGVLAALAGDMGLKAGGRTGYIVGAVFYALSSIPIYWAYRLRDDFGMVGVLWQVVMGLAFMTLSVAYYREPLTTRRISIFLLTLAVIILCAGDKS